jgi:predicted AAA+ superfamily ATPase
MRNVSESLAGRVAILEILPFSRLEHQHATLEEAV